MKPEPIELKKLIEDNKKHAYQDAVDRLVESVVKQVSDQAKRGLLRFSITVSLQDMPGFDKNGKKWDIYRTLNFACFVSSVQTKIKNIFIDAEVEFCITTRQVIVSVEE